MGWASKPNVIRDKSFAFAVRVVKMSMHLQGQKGEYVLSRQVLRSGTAVGALVREAEQAESKADFIHKLAIALKEANETQYWLELLRQADILGSKEYDSMNADSVELIRLLTRIILSTKTNVK